MAANIEERAEALTEKLPRFRLVHVGDLKPRAMDWLVRELFERDSLGAMFGKAGAAKTFVALDIACCVATGTDYHGRAVKAGPVVYIVGEGFNGIARRLKAWSIRHSIELADIPLHVSTMPARMTDMESLAQVMGAIEETGTQPELLVLDTVARNFGPGDENSTSDMGEFVWACDELRRKFDCAVLLVHHSGHGDTSRGRGSSVLDGALDTAYRLTRNGDLITVTNTKMKDGPEPDPLGFRFRAVELGFTNDDGTPATSAVLHPADVLDEPPPATGKHQKHALDCLDDLFKKHCANLTSGGLPAENAKVITTDWRDACTADGMPRPRWYDAKASLAAIGVIQITGKYVTRRSANDV